MTDPAVTMLERIRNRVAAEVSADATEHSWPGMCRILIAQLDRRDAQLALQREEIERRRRVTIQLRHELVQAQQAAQSTTAATFPNHDEPRMILKAAPDRDLYIGWSTMCESPAGSWTRAEALEYGIDPVRLERADVTGTSFIEPHVGGWDDTGMIAEQRGVLPRRHLAAYAELWLSGQRDQAYELLEPFDED